MDIYKVSIGKATSQTKEGYTMDNIFRVHYRNSKGEHWWESFRSLRSAKKFAELCREVEDTHIWIESITQ